MTATCTYVVTYMFLDALIHMHIHASILVSTLRAAYSVTVKDISYS